VRWRDDVSQVRQHHANERQRIVRNERWQRMNVERKRKTVDILVVRLRRPGAMSWTSIIAWH
jgi:hypothetical protein